MNRIASFSVNHNTLTRGMYTSRRDGDIVTYDLRFRRPNREPVLSNAVSHSIEHLMATVLRNGPMSDKVIYFGPMGCRTGFYLLLRDVGDEDAVSLTRNALEVCAVWNAPLPGNSAAECGNYLEHDPEGAKLECSEMAKLLHGWNAAMLAYPQ